jgi:hypothetical protein
MSVAREKSFYTGLVTQEEFGVRAIRFLSYSHQDAAVDASKARDQSKTAGILTY